MNQDELYSKIEKLIISWDNDNSKTADHLTREIMQLISDNNLLSHDDTHDDYPCNFDHNGECLICDCWGSDCAYIRYIKQDYKWETKEELEKMFNKK